MDQRNRPGVARGLAIAAIWLAPFACLAGGARAQVAGGRQIHCTVQRAGNAAGPIDLLIDFQGAMINGAPADGRFRKGKNGDLNAYSIFSSQLIIDIEAWTQDAGPGGVRAIDYITVDRLHSAVRATTVPLPGGRSVAYRGDCDSGAGRSPGQ